MCSKIASKDTLCGSTDYLCELHLSRQKVKKKRKIMRLEYVEYYYYVIKFHRSGALLYPYDVRKERKQVVAVVTLMILKTLGS